MVVKELNMKNERYANIGENCLATQPINQKINTHSCENNAIDNTKSRKSFAVGKGSINYKDDKHGDKQSRKLFFFSTLHNLPSAPHLINTEIKRIIKRLATKCK